MDPITAIGLATSIVTFIQLATTILQRFDEISVAGEVPKVFREVKSRLPLLMHAVKMTEASMDRISMEARKALGPVIQSCSVQMRQLDDVLRKVTTGHGESAVRRAIKVVISLAEEANVRKIENALYENVQILTLYHATGADVRPLRADPGVVFMQPCERDGQFVGREDTLAAIKKAFKSQSRVGLAGIGGVGFVFTKFDVTVSHG
jgi:hypothetical protein